MLDTHLRPTKEHILLPICHRIIPSAITPTHLTLVAFLLGLASCYTAATADNVLLPLTLWLLNRLLDSLDGSLARSRNLTTEAGGFLDLLCDFIIYSLIPIAVAQGRGDDSPWRAVAFLEATFHINNFVLLYVAAVEAKTSTANGSSSAQTRSELTSLMMKPALVEGVESGVFFTAMLAFPRFVSIITWVMGGAVAVGVVQRVRYILPALERVDLMMQGGERAKVHEKAL